MNATPQPMIVGSQGGWAIALVFVDAFGNPVDLTKTGLKPVADFYQPNLARTTSCTVLLTNTASGQAIALVPQDVVLSTLAPAPYSVLLGAASAAAVGAPCRLHAYVVDSQGTASAHIVAAIQPVDPRTADPSAIPAMPALAVVAGPAGAPGGKGDAGQPGAAGSADPQTATLAGAVGLHQLVFNSPAGALLASCDQPGQAGKVLGLSLAAGALGIQITYSAAGVVTDQAWNWTPGPIFLGLNGALTQQLPAAATFVQQVALALSPTSLRMGLRASVMIDVPAGSVAPTYRDMAGGIEHLRAAAIGPGTQNALVATDPTGHLAATLLPPRGVGTSRLAGGPQLAGLPNGCFEDGFDAWAVSLTGKAEATIDPAASIVGGQSAYLHCPNPGDVASITSAAVPAGEGIPLYVATRAMLRSGACSAVLAAIFFDRNGVQIGQPMPIGGTLQLGLAMAEIGGYVLPPAGTRYAAASVTNTAAAGAVGAINVDEVMVNRQIGGPAAWQIRRAARPAIVALGGDMGAFLAMFGDVGALDGTGEADEGATPAPVGGIVYATLSTYLQRLGLQGADLTAQLAAIWAAAVAVTPMPLPTAPTPAVVSVRTGQIVGAVRPVLVQRGGLFSAFEATYLNKDSPDRGWESLYVYPTASIGGVLYNHLLSYLTDAAPKGLAQPSQQSVADLAAVWAAAPGLSS